ncbi:hypothetical protein [Rhizobium leguminosarum]|uniref:hypothetical protein n=1 Tax=Rhizobium leguminosarum TaxID=384 RepID=UPI0024B3AAB1|nr:hypothetical protein [Rhizobium leguminosarum]WHO79922.1 hypothetical protein QMO81_002627 [Rhizobium leguminosarum]
MDWKSLIDAMERLAAAAPAAKDMLDLQAQIDMAYWAKWMFWASIGSLSVSLVAIVAAFSSLRASREAAADSRKAAADSREVGEFQTQAYVHARSARLGTKGNVIIACKNSGLTPATHFSVNATAKIVSPGNVAASISFKTDGFKTWSALGANDELTVSILDGDPVVSQFARTQGGDDKLLVSGQITYCTIFNHDHVTQFAFYAEPRTKHRFRRPTASLTTFSRIPEQGFPSPQSELPVLLTDNDEDDANVTARG